MRAILYDRWGGPEVLRLAEVEKPTPADDEVLVRVHAASANSWDWDLLAGTRYITRPQGFASGPKRLGFDVAGVVESVGANVNRFAPGDAVFGDIAWDGPGTFADYVCAKEKRLTLKPAELSWEQAAALPQAGLLALQGLRATERGDRVLLNGAGGGVGTLGIQIAKSRGATVTGVDSAEKLETMRKAGADHVIDYRSEDFTRTGGRYDLILDVVANRPLSAYARALNRGGRLIVVGGRPGVVIRSALLGPLLGLLSGRRMGLMIYKPNVADLDHLAALALAGKVVPVIDSVHPLENAAEAMRRLGEGHALGKVVVAVSAGAT